MFFSPIFLINEVSEKSIWSAVNLYLIGAQEDWNGQFGVWEIKEKFALFEEIKSRLQLEKIDPSEI